MATLTRTCSVEMLSSNEKSPQSCRGPAKPKRWFHGCDPNTGTGYPPNQWDQSEPGMWRQWSSYCSLDLEPQRDDPRWLDPRLSYSNGKLLSKEPVALSVAPKRREEMNRHDNCHVSSNSVDMRTSQQEHPAVSIETSQNKDSQSKRQVNQNNVKTNWASRTQLLKSSLPLFQANAKSPRQKVSEMRAASSHPVMTDYSGDRTVSCENLSSADSQISSSTSHLTNGYPHGGYRAQPFNGRNMSRNVTTQRNCEPSISPRRSKRDPDRRTLDQMLYPPPECVPRHVTANSDSGIEDVESQLKEKEQELRQLHEVMERNERAILQVVEEKKTIWEREMNEKKKALERRLQTVEQTSRLNEQNLRNQVKRLQQENNSLRSELELMRLEKSRLVEDCSNYEKTLLDTEDKLKGMMFAAERPEANSLHRPDEDDDVSSTKVKVTLQSKNDCDSKELCIKVDDENADGSVRSFGRGTVDVPKRTLSNHSDTDSSREANEIYSLTMNIIKSKDIGFLQEELDRTKGELETCKMAFRDEQEKWLSEKKKVINYQKQLQLNYLQISEKNEQLEQENKQLKNSCDQSLYKTYC